MADTLGNENLNPLQEEIIKLSQLDKIAYEVERGRIAKEHKIRVTALDELVNTERKKDGLGSESNVLFPEVEPWHEPIDACHLLTELEEMINRFMAFSSKHEVKAITLHIVHTHCIDSADCSPILNISSPEKRCGKSTLLSILQRLNRRALLASSISSAAVYRSIEKWQPTLMIDEADTFFRDNEELRGVINSGHTRDSAFVVRCVGDDHEPARFNTWCPKVIAGIGHLPDTIEDRSIIIQLRRKLPDEKKDKLRDVPELLFKNLFRKCIRFANDNLESLNKTSPLLPETLNDRAADSWTPLLAICELANNEWIKAGREAADYLSGSKREALSISIELLQDIKNIFETENLIAIHTVELIDKLCSDSEAPWLTYNRGRPLSARQLASKLREFGIHSENITLPPQFKRLKGYYCEHFSEAFSRYCGKDEIKH